MKRLSLLLVAGFILVGITSCNMIGAMGGGGTGMMARHTTNIPDEYAGVTNSISPDKESLARGGEIYSASCAACHGDGGMGDGPAAGSLNPAPAPIAYTSQMLGDDYLFWRISEGGMSDPFNSLMPAWKSVLSEQERWDVINYIRAVGSGKVKPKQSAGGESVNPRVAERDKMLTSAVEQGVLTQQEADLFNKVHVAMDVMLLTGLVEPGGDMGQVEEKVLAILVENGEISQDEADSFNIIGNKLVESDLMQ